MSGISALSRRLQGRHWPQTRKWASAGNEHAGALKLDFPASRMVGNKSVVYKLPRLWYFVRAA